MDTEKDSCCTFFTIVIPTRERSDTLVHALSAALAQDYEHFEVLVSDNASQDDTAEKVAQIKDSRLRYVNTGQRVSMSENWEFALNYVEKGWITVLGDDDALLPGALRRANEIINKTGLSVIRSNDCTYKWPGFGGSKYGSLTVSLRRGYEIRSSGDMLQKVLDGRRNYNELPMLYNGGFVSLDLIKQAKKITGNFFQSMTPDVYSAIVFSLLTEKYVYSYEPLAINGASLHSGGTAGFEKKKEKRKYDPSKKFLSENNIPFHSDLPLMRNGHPVFSIEVIVYEAFLQAEKFHKFKKISTTNQKQLEVILKGEPKNRSELVEWCEEFANKHNLVIKKLKNREYNLRKYIEKIKVITKVFWLNGSERIPLKNVNEASIAVGLLKEMRPNKIGSIAKRLYKKLR